MTEWMKKMLLGLGLAVLVSSCTQQYDNEDDFRVAPVNGDKAVKITSYVGEKQSIRIPPRIGGKPVIEIGEDAFEEKEIISVTIPNSITVIGENAFANNLITVMTIPNKVITIENDAFADNQLADVIIPNSVTSIGDKAFNGNQLTSVTIGSGVTSIGDTAFAATWDSSSKTYTGNQLTSVTIRANVSLTTGDYASFGFGFETVYANNSKQAGAYTRPDTDSTTWKSSGDTIL
jgi:hypothetical protein